MMIKIIAFDSLLDGEDDDHDGEDDDHDGDGDHVGDSSTSVKPTAVI